MFRRLSCVIAAAMCLASGLALAQGEQPDYSAPAHIAVVQGVATLERNGVADTALENLPLLQGDRLKTDAGRIEIILPDGSILDLDRQTTVDLLDGGLLRVQAGRIVFVVGRPYGGGEARRDYQVDAPAGSVRFSGAGEYRVSAQVSSGLPFLEVSVVRGEAVIDAEGRSVPLRPGERAQVAQGQGVTAVGTFNSAVADAFIEWTEDLRGQRAGRVSNAYLPPDLQVYGGAFDRDGSWETSSDYGPVWYPRVEADWRPYYDGGWYPYSWGWTWVSAGRWAWPTHHYGRWGHGDRGWFWMPAANWGPAWVSWGFGGDYVSWCPLGYHDRPAFGLSFGVSVGHANAWLGWTVVPQHAFGHGYRVPSYAIHGQHLRTVEHVNFAVRRAGPSVPGGATTQRFGSGRTSPYDRAQAAAEQRVGSNPGWGHATPRSQAATPATRSAAPRAWTTRPDGQAGAPGGQAPPRDVGGRRDPQTAGNPGGRTWSTESSAVGGARPADTSPFSSPAPSGSPYPERYRSTPTGPATSALGSAVPRSAPSRPADSRSPYYYMGPSQRRDLPAPPPAAADRPAAGQRGGQGDAAVPRGDFDSPSSWQPSPSYRTYPGASPSVAQPSGADPRASSGSRSSSTYSAPDRSAQPRSAAPSASSPSGGSSAPSGPAPSAHSAGGRTPGYSSGGGASAGGGRASGGGSTSGGHASGGGRSSGGGGRGGRGR